MTALARDIIEGAVAILLIGRGIMSHIEHKKNTKRVEENKKDTTEIKMFFNINGEMEKRLEQARQEGKQDGRNEVLNAKK